MNEGRYLNFFNQTEVEPITPEEELSGELAAESAKLEANLEGLGDDVTELGGEENLKVALEKKPHVAVSIAKRAAIIAPILISINAIASGSFSDFIDAKDTVEIAKFVMTVIGGSTIISAFIETGKLLSPRETV